MATLYWVGGSGTLSWDGPPGTGTGWSTTSGGSGGASRPTAVDDVVFNSSSGSGTCYINPGAVCKTLTMTGYTGTITGNGLTASGNVTLASGVTCSGLRLTFDASATLTSAGKTIDSITVSAGTLTGSGAVSATNAITVSDGATIAFPNGVTSSCGSLVTPGSGLAYVISSSSGSQATLSDSSGTNDLTYVSLKDMNLTGGATWATGAGFVDAGNNTITSSATAIDPIFCLSHL